MFRNRARSIISYTSFARRGVYCDGFLGTLNKSSHKFLGAEVELSLVGDKKLQRGFFSTGSKVLLSPEVDSLNKDISNKSHSLPTASPETQQGARKVPEQVSLNNKLATDETIEAQIIKTRKTSKKSPIVFNNKNPSLQDFITAAHVQAKKEKGESDTVPAAVAHQLPYLTSLNVSNNFNVESNTTSRKYFTEVYGCQMNVSDAEILSSVMNSAGYVQTLTIEEADIIFLVTCSIRDAAEQKIWHRLYTLKTLKRAHHPQNLPPVVGVLGCMAERLKEKLLESDKLVDLVCGPDAYRSIPHLISLNETSTQGVANVILSADETYADIVPVRRDENSRSAFLSIMRGCNNMCSYCIVPFTRGTERSRPVDSIIEEVKRLSEQGIKEVVLLGQNVNSYRDVSNPVAFEPKGFGGELSSPGFRTIYKRKDGGLRFAELVERVAQVDGEMRVRFTSPHPKDFPDALLDVIRRYPNVCNNLHLPAQSGSSAVLERMRRGYTREAYLELAQHVRDVIPGVTFSSDFITGFCGETDQDHRDTVTLMEEVKFDMAYMFAYSLREGTHAHRRMTDDVPSETKNQRLREIIAVFHAGAADRLSKLVGVPQLVLVDGPTQPRHLKNGKVLGGRTDGNHRAFLFKDPSINPDLYSLKSGDYVVFLPTSSSSTSLTGIPLGASTLQDFYSKGLTPEMKSLMASKL